MTLKNYQQLTNRTNVDLGTKAINASHMVLGIVGEFAEFHLACQGMDIENIKKEGSDICWYISELANLFDLQLKAKECIHWPFTLDIMVGDITEMIKKFLAYDKAVDVNKLDEYLCHLIFYINLIFKEYEIDFEECLDLNIKKLLLRYPDKFSQEDALAKKDEL